MAEPLNWDEFRIVQAIAEAQSLSGAAERVALNPSTLFRRLAALETRLGVKLFTRERTGYRPTAAGEDMVALATLMGETIREFERRVADDEVKLSGCVRVSTVNSIGALVLPPICAALSALHTAIRIELLLTEMTVDLSQGEADIALRCLRQPPPDHLVSRRVAPLPWAIYAVPPSEGCPGRLSEGMPWIVPSESFGPPLARRWIDRNIEPSRRVATASSDVVIAELAARGVGAALLPCYVAVTHPKLRRLGNPETGLDGDLWLLANERAHRAPRVRAAFDFLGRELERRRAWFEGETVVDG